ncbi:MAG: RBBP9/YdeN family alpha/beta hydrolase [Rhodoluna sp.]
MAKVLILHGWTNRRQSGHWQRHLAAALRQQGHVVAYPQFPSPDEPKLNEWQELLAAELDILADVEDGETIVIGHSLGCINWIQAASTGLIKNSVDRVLLVAPADPRMLGEVEGLNVELTNPDVAAALHSSTSKLIVLASEKDKWTPRGIQATFGTPLGVEPVILQGAGHLSLDDGFGYWPGVINWVNDATADLTER